MFSELGTYEKAELCSAPTSERTATAQPNRKRSCGGILGFVPKPVAEAAKAFVSQRFTRETPKFLANSATTYTPAGFRDKA